MTNPNSDAPIAVEGMHFYMYLVEEMPRARAFYERLFELVPGAFDSENFVEYGLPDGSTFALGLLPNAPRDPSGGAMFGVPDADAAIARVEALGGKLMGRFGGKICSSGWCLDTEGNAFGVHQRFPREG